MTSPLLALVHEHKRGRSVGAYALCTASRVAIEAGLQQALADRTPVCIEATSNQVDQFGGYTGLTPAQFAALVRDAATAAGFPWSGVILGGDHLGPNAWRDRDARAAMGLAVDLVRAYVAAGFTKLHLDASMSCADDGAAGQPPLTTHAIAERTAELAAAAEAAYAELPAGSTPPLYVVGTEVPRPGGAQEELAGVEPTTPAEAAETIALTAQAFAKRNLRQAWKRVVAVVVQPGVEFGDHAVIPYDRPRAAALSAAIAGHDQLVYEAHSTDYQAGTALKQMVEDHFAILKVGPWLTFAFREAVFALAAMEQELLRGQSVARSDLPAVLDRVMLAQPKFWAPYYHGDADALAFARKYSFSDRARYYWTHPLLQQALGRLYENLARFPPPRSLLSQHLPAQAEAVREGRLAISPAALVRDRVREVVATYARACRG